MFVFTAAALSLKSFHARPFQDELNAFLSKVSWAYGSYSDCLAALNTYDVRTAFTVWFVACSVLVLGSAEEDCNHYFLTLMNKMSALVNLE